MLYETVGQRDSKTLHLILGLLWTTWKAAQFCPCPLSGYPVMLLFFMNGLFIS